MTLEEADKKPEPEFDPATWTPDKPWPKGYHKPYVPGVMATSDRINRASGQGDMGSRFIFWVLPSIVSQWVGAAAARPTPIQPFGMVAIAIQRLVGAWLLPVFLIAVLPALLYAVIVPPPGTRFRRSFAYGLGWALALRIVLMIVVRLLPFPH